ncbi:hypothetical protein IFM53868_06536 [Aspergillus udagawae]|uniref:CENP-V/GFA domain-containing protein n=1 Tax=Aspergillus udagawae TaxID=91492 RepID=A0ABQ1B376_9EURO|nr:hypothetical protein IFM53868_06536 [Aspergillus udagawae]
MYVGHCYCGASRVKINCEPVAVGLCHCLDCRKVSGSTNALNWFIPSEQMTASGPLKTFSKTLDHGNDIVNTFCSDCGTTLFREGQAMPGTRFLKAGILDDPTCLNAFKPQGEIFVSRRVDWLSPVPGASQKQELFA